MWGQRMQQDPQSTTPDVEAAKLCLKNCKFRSKNTRKEVEETRERVLLIIILHIRNINTMF